MRRNYFAPRIAASIVVLTLLVTSVTTVAAVFTSPGLPAQSGSLLVKAPNLPELLQKAQAEGGLPVIVMLNVPFQAESQLSSPAAVDTQQAALLQTQDALLARLTGYEPASVKEYHFIPAMAIRVNAAGLAALVADPRVASIEEDQADQVELAESVPLIGAPAVWASDYSGAGQYVAILDTGVDKNHAFLAGKVKSEACYSTSNSGYPSYSLCPGGASSSTAVNSALPYGTGVCPAGMCDHGTHVAGIAAGHAYSNASGTVTFSGVARDANIIAIQIFSKFNANNCPSGYPNGCAKSFYSDQISGLQRVYDLRNTYAIAAVNMSLGSGYYRSQSACDADNNGPSSRKTAIDNLRTAGIAVIAASGNDGLIDGMGSPACISSAISVGSTGDGSTYGGELATVDEVSSYSNSASFLSLLAPGMWITSSVPGGSEHNYATWAGTSMATPHVTGAWAVLKSKFPTASVDQILNALKTSGKPVTDGRNGIITPRIQLDMAANQGFSVSGQVTAGVGGPGLAGVTISAGAAHTTTDASGNYTLSGLLGTYTLTPSLGTNSFTPSVITSLVVSANQAGVNFVATPYTISGTVKVGATGLVGVMVSADATHTATTAAGGSYIITGLLVGTYIVTPAMPEYTFSPVTKSVTVGPSSTTTNFAATQKTYTITGVITPAVAGVSLSDGAGHTATTIANGSYTFSGLVAGSYIITPTMTAHSFNPVSAPVTLGPSAAGINFTNIPGYTASGKIMVGSGSGPALAGVTVTVDATHTATTDVSGKYTVVGLAVGSYTLTPSLAEFNFAPPTLPVTVGPNAAGQDFVATQITYTVSGTVTLGGSGMDGVTVVDGAGHTALTNPAGDYTLSGLVKGTYFITPILRHYAFLEAVNPVIVSGPETGVNFTAILVPLDIFLPLVDK